LKHKTATSFISRQLLIQQLMYKTIFPTTFRLANDKTIAPKHANQNQSSANYIHEKNDLGTVLLKHLRTTWTYANI